MITKNQIIKRLNLKPHPEGGFYSETYRSEEILPTNALPQRYRSDRSTNTAIYFLLTSESCSMMHQLCSDEIFHFYLGDPVTMLHLHPNGSSETITVGPDILNGQKPQVIVAKDTWQGSFIEGDGKFALLGTTVAPGFDFEDFNFGDRNLLIKQYPDQHELITKLTRATPS